jgi:hypothetical protein
VNPSTCSPDRLKRLRELCLSFPETDERLDHGDPRWTVNGKGFASQKGNYDGGRPSVWFKPTPADHKALPNSYREKFFVPHTPARRVGSPCTSIGESWTGRR